MRKYFKFTQDYATYLENMDESQAGQFIKAVSAYAFDGQEYSGDDVKVMSAYIYVKTLLDIKGLFIFRKRTGSTASVKDKLTAGINKTFKFTVEYAAAVNNMDDSQAGQYIKALCGYAFEGKDFQNDDIKVMTAYVYARTMLNVRGFAKFKKDETQTKKIAAAQLKPFDDLLAKKITIENLDFNFSTEWTSKNRNPNRLTFPENFCIIAPVERKYITDMLGYICPENIDKEHTAVIFLTDMYSKHIYAQNLVEYGSITESKIADLFKLGAMLRLDLNN